MSSRPTTPKGTPRRTAKRTPLQEKSSSEKNEEASRLQRELKAEISDADIFNCTPFPTKPQQILLPSTIRKQRSRYNLENELPTFLSVEQQVVGSQAGLRSQDRLDERRIRRAPNLQLKRSVTALRDIYEAQAEKSRPSTAVPSPALRPTTANSRLRSASSSEGMFGRSAWAFLPGMSSDDPDTLPTLSEATVQKINVESFASRMKTQGTDSSPNFKAYTSTGLQIPDFQDLNSSSDPLEPPSTVGGPSFSDMMEPFSGGSVPAPSSPNFVRLGGTSSPDMFEPSSFGLEPIEESSSPNVIKMGTSSPQRTSSPVRSDASTVLRKRKRLDTDHAPDAGNTPLFGHTGGRSSVSPTPHNIGTFSDGSLSISDDGPMPSSPPQMGSFHARTISSSSPVTRLPGTERHDSTDTDSMASTHMNVQSVRSSSPLPPMKHPIVKAPNINQFLSLSAFKRNLQNSNLETEIQDEAEAPNWREEGSLSPPPLLGAPSMLRQQKSDRSIFTDETGGVGEMGDCFDPDLMIPDQAYMTENDPNDSREHFISDADLHEATDELSALPRESRGYRPPTLIPARSTSFLGTSFNSSRPRLSIVRAPVDVGVRSMNGMASMRSLVESTHSSTPSGRHRPGSAGSGVVPTWARRYYSGAYRDQFQYLYQSQSNLGSTASLTFHPSISIQRGVSYPSLRAGTSVSRSSHGVSFKSIRSSISNYMPSITMPKTRTRLDVRKSHTTAGIGPLVSNPVNESSLYRSNTIRQITEPLPPVDPRAHWAGIAEEDGEMYDGTQPRSEYTESYRPAPSFYSRQHRGPLRSSLRRLRLNSPHLHHDRRLNSGSSISRGYGYPFNQKPRYLPTELSDTETQPTCFRVDVRSFQVICFMTGFVLPLMWFVGALAPLPQRPAHYVDIEKAEIAARQRQMTQEMDVVAKLRFERQIQGTEEVKWQNARWWRRMNRWMCLVGTVVIIVVIVLAVIGTKSHW